ncbi:Uncharacterized protein HZ326_6653 [Fusarium oxysporum f. sp. albedinis]|nr:Uncharacterized protein HZ326_6653 [Fusarium oxysporum f. sp. albedinis]
MMYQSGWGVRTKRPWDMLMITWEFGRPEVAVFSLKPIAMGSSYDRHQLRDTYTNYQADRNSDKSFEV